MSRSCLIIGAGMAGLTAGRRLQELGWRVTLVDKGRTVGGRMATRRFGGGVFDHGAQFFTVRDPRFRAEVDGWLANGIAREWFTQEGHTRYCGVQGMNAVPQHLARGLDVHVSEHVAGVYSDRVETRNASYQADAILFTAPVEQSLAMLQVELQPGTLAKLKRVAFEPCFSMMALLEQPSRVPAPGYSRPSSGSIAWIADNQQKGISPVPAVTIHATPAFTTHHWESDRVEVGRLLMEAAGLQGVIDSQVHRWRYSMLSQTLPEQCLVAGAFVFAGDAFGGPRVEGAYLSGLAAAEATDQLTHSL